MGGRSVWLRGLLRLPVLKVQVMSRNSATPLQCHMSSSLVSFASLGCRSCLSSTSFSGDMQPHASSSRFSFASSCIFSSMAMALLVLA